MVKETIEQFNRLQELDSRIHELETQLARIPEMLRESRERFEALESDKNKSLADLETQRKDLAAAEISLADLKDMLALAQKKLTSVQNNKEYEAALKELDTQKKNIADTENRIASLKTSVAELEEVITTKTSAAETTGNVYETEKTEKESENKALFDELESLQKERVKYADTVKKSLLSKYERVRSARQNIAIAAINGEVCTGCNMKIPPQMAVEVKKELELLQCPYCQRFLYNPKEEIAAEAS